MAFLDLQGVSRLWSHIVSRLDNKVDKEEGKSLSTNDYTTAEKEKLQNIEENANNYILPVSRIDVLGGVKVGANLTLLDDGQLQLTKTNVTSALGYTPPTADKNVDVEIRGGTTNNAAFMPVGITTGVAGETVNRGLVRYTDVAFNVVRGSEDVLGRVQLVLGNNIPQGTDGNKHGRLTLYSPNGMVSGSLVQEDRDGVTSTHYATNTLPHKSGTLLNTGNYKDFVTLANIGAESAGAAAQALTDANEYTDKKVAEAKTYTDTSVANLVNSAPETLDTLGEVAKAIEENETVVEALNAAIGNKVNKVEGKGLSTHDYTDDEKNKLASIENGANNTIVDSSLSSTSTNPVQNKVVNDAISNLSILVGDTPVAAQIADAMQFATDDEILALLSEVDAFPSVTDESGSVFTDETGSILLV